MQRLKTAVIGTGFMGRVHLEALRRIEFVDIVAIAGRRPGSSKKLADQFCLDSLDDYTKLFSDATLDAVHICTPNASHYHMAREAMLAGKHVLCEKPLSVSVAEAQDTA